VRDYRRSSSRQNARVQALASRGEAANVATPADVAARHEAAGIVETILAQIDEGKRTVFVLVEIEQMSVAEVAEALGLNVNTTHSRLRAARQQFESAVVRFRAREKR
jgi:RNA polymerase sigma-70 factor (ECF subfamily)